MFNWILDNGIDCDIGGRWFGGIGFVGVCCIDWVNCICWVCGRGIFIFIVEILVLRGWYCWDIEGVNCCGGCKEVIGRNCSKK